MNGAVWSGTPRLSASAFATSASAGDLFGDGSVDGNDLSILLSAWGDSINSITPPSVATTGAQSPQKAEQTLLQADYPEVLARLVPVPEAAANAAAGASMAMAGSAFFAYPREIKDIIDALEYVIFGDEVTKGTCHEEVFLPPILFANHVKPPCKRLNFVLEILPPEVHIDYRNAEDFFNNHTVRAFMCYDSVPPFCRRHATHSRGHTDAAIRPSTRKGVEQ